MMYDCKFLEFAVAHSEVMTFLLLYIWATGVCVCTRTSRARTRYAPARKNVINRYITKVIYLKNRIRKRDTTYLSKKKKYTSYTSKKKVSEKTSADTYVSGS